MSSVLKQDSLAPYIQAAFERAVEQIMRGEVVPRSGPCRLALDDFLDQRVPVEQQTEDYIDLLICNEDALSDVRRRIRESIESRLREYLTGHQVVRDVAQRLWEEDE